MPYDRFVARAAHRQRQQLPRAAGELLPGRAEPASRRRIAQAVALTFMGARAENWPKAAAGRHGGVLLADRLQVHGRMEGGDRLLRSRASAAPPAERRCSPTARRPRCRRDQDPREVFADWLIDAAEPLVRPQHRQPRLVLAAGPRASSTSRTTSGPTIRPAIPSCWPTWSSEAGRGPLRPEAHLPADPELARPTSFPRMPRSDRPAGRGQFRLLSAAAAGGRGADRRPVPDHRHHREVLQRDSRAVHVHSRGRSGRSPCPTAASPARSWRCSAGRRATPAWSRSATTGPRPTSGCTC